MTTKTFTKVDITREMADISDRKQSEIKPLVDDFFTAIRHLLMKDEKADILRIEVRNFGTFEVKPTKAKPKARNPRTSEIIYVAPRKKTHFTPGKILKKYLAQPLKK